MQKLVNTLAGATVVGDYDVAPDGTHIKPNTDPNTLMKSAQWYGSKDIRVVETPKPVVTDPEDVVIKVTSTCICGSDLHLYLGAMPGMQKGDIMGHESMGIVTDVGPNVRTLKPGDKVVVAFCIACGHCTYCNKEQYSSCDGTNPSKEQKMLYGHRTAGLFGYSHLTGGFPGGQAEYLRVPHADLGCIKVPQSLPDDSAVLLADILPTGWHASELGKVGQGDTVAIWGCGPVGMLAAHCSFARGAARVVLIDQEQERLDFAKDKIPHVETINFKEKKTLDALKEMFSVGDSYVGPDVCIEAVGFHYTSTWTHYIEMSLGLENDPSEIINELIYACRKGGRIGIVGVYSGFANHINIGAFMEKGLSMAAGQTPVQKYWHKLLEKIENGTLDPKFVVTHRLPLEQAPHGYKIFNDKTEGCVKVVLKPGLSHVEE